MSEVDVFLQRQPPDPLSVIMGKQPCARSNARIGCDRDLSFGVFHVRGRDPHFG